MCRSEKGPAYGPFSVHTKPPTEWREVTVDLWTITKGKPPRIQALSLIAAGDGAAFDKITLARSDADFQKELK